MRMIQFRGLRTDGSEWLIGDLNHIDGKVYIFPRDGSASLNSPDWFEVKPKSIGQFTGLHDKHGTPIFEGDVFQNFPYPNGFSGTILWSEDELQWMCLYNTSKLIPLCERAAHIEIIGHIFQTEAQ